MRKSTAAVRCLECANSSHRPPPTSPVLGVAVPGHCGIAATASCPLGVFSPAAVSNTAPPNQAPRQHQDLTRLVLVELRAEHTERGHGPLTNVSSSEAILAQFALVAFTVTALRPVIWLAGHWLAHM